MVRGTDYLTCGGCQLEFPLSNIVIFMKHKYDCSSTGQETDQIIEQYTCFTCPKTFSAAISLLQHAQYQHHLSVFREKKSTISSKQSGNGSPETSGIGQPNNSEEQLEKCCAAVVPKKRKRHIEMKHKIRSKTRSNSASSDIYIDLNQESMDSLEITPYTRGSQIQLESGRTFTIPMTSQTNEDNHYLGISYESSDPRDSPTVTTSATSNTSFTKLVTAQSSHPSTTMYTASGDSEQEQKTPTMNIIMSRSRHTNGDRKKTEIADGKPFKCDHCDNSFNQRIHLKKHLSKHTGVKPFKCGQCSYATVERSHLKVHIRIHTGEKPFKCHHCEYATAQNSTLKIHLKRHHGSLILECVDCAELNKSSTIPDTIQSIEPTVISNPNHSK